MQMAKKERNYLFDSTSLLNGDKQTLRSITKVANAVVVVVWNNFIKCTKRVTTQRHVLLKTIKTELDSSLMRESTVKLRTFAAVYLSIYILTFNNATVSY